MPHCLPTRGRALLPPGSEQGQGVEVELSWQELMSLAELQGFNLPESVNEGMHCNGAQVSSHGLGYCHGPICPLAQDHPMPGCGPNFLPAYDRGYPTGSSPAHGHRPHPQPGPAGLGTLDTDFEGMSFDRIPISSSSSNTHTHPGAGSVTQGNMSMSLNLSLTGLLNDPLLEHLVQLGISEGFAGHPQGKGHEDWESDSGLSLDSSPALASSPVNSASSVPIGDSSLTYSDTESMDVEGLEYGRLRAENAEMYPQMEFHLPPTHYRPLPSSSSTSTSSSSSVQRMAALAGYAIDVSEAPPPPPGFTGLPGGRRAHCHLLPQSERPNRDAGLSRDQRRAFHLRIPFSTGEIVNLPVDDFNELLSRYQLAEPQLALVRDIRRRGKNKVAAQNCRKRKLDNIVLLEHDLSHLKSAKEQLVKERVEFDRTLGLMKQKLNELYRQIFGVLRDSEGCPYSPDDFSLRQDRDGGVFLVPHAAEEGKD